MSNLVAQLLDLLERATPEQREMIFRRLRKEFSIHPLEVEWSISAEAILEAISRSPDLTQRGIRGILAEASFFTIVYPTLQAHGWEDVTPDGDLPYDAALRDETGTVRIQVKLQRRKSGRPMTGIDAPRGAAFLEGVFVVETQKTRAGKKDGEDTRPYRFGEFDILAVSLSPSTKDWSKFLFTVATWLLPDPSDPARIYKYQPVPPMPNLEWTDDLLVCIGWLRSGDVRRIRIAP